MNTTITKKDAVKAARAFSSAQMQYTKTFREYLASLEPLPEERFWEMVDIYHHLIIRNMEKFSVSEMAAHELFRVPHADSRKIRPTGVRRSSKYTFDEALRFANDWGTYKSALYNPLFEIVENRSDDSYGDLLDNLPLLGPKFYARCLKKEFSNGTNFENAAAIVANVCAGPYGMEAADQYRRFVLDGENYNSMMLKDKAEEFFAYHVRKD
jgi:hypothetical protein